MLTPKKIVGLITLFLGLTFCLHSMSPGQKLAQVESDNSAATLSGTVVNATTQNPLSDVKVKIPLANKQTKTNKKGKFVLQGLDPGNYQVKVDHKGYQSYSNSVNLQDGDKQIVIKLKPSSQGH